MKSVTRIAAMVLLIVVFHVPAFAASQPVFPGAVGFGADSRAGTDGEVIRVTNLEGDGPGSLRAALETPGERLVVFEVAGVIDLDGKGLAIREPFVTVAGQTAPSPGITIIGGGLSVTTHDVLIQHVRIRPGDRGKPKGSGWEPDGLSTSGGNAYNVVVDHCSLTWAVDENLSASGPRLDGPEATSHRITFSNNIIAEGLNDSSHSKGPHSKGTLIHDFCQDIAIIGNLYAHNHQRNPYFKAFTTGVIVNNVIYNPGAYAIQLGYHPPEWRDSDYEPQNCRVSIVGNLLVHGSDTRKDLQLATRPGDVYFDDNLAFDAEGKPVEIHDKSITVLDEKPAWPEGLRPVPAAGVADSVVENAGARPWDRDAIDRRIIQTFIERTGRIIDSQEEVGGYPTHEPVRRALDVPESNRRVWLSTLRPSD